MTRADAQRALDALTPGHALTVSLGRHRATGAVVHAVARWRGVHTFRESEAAALRDLVAAAYRVRRLPLPPELDAPASLPGVR